MKPNKLEPLTNLAYIVIKEVLSFKRSLKKRIYFSNSQRQKAKKIRIVWHLLWWITLSRAISTRIIELSLSKLYTKEILWQLTEHNLIEYRIIDNDRNFLDILVIDIH